jgi:hypothetical protein
MIATGTLLWWEDALAAEPRAILLRGYLGLEARSGAGRDIPVGTRRYAFQFNYWAPPTTLPIAGSLTAMSHRSIASSLR